MASGISFRIVGSVAILLTSLSDQDLQAVELNSPDQTLRLTLTTNPKQELLGYLLSHEGIPILTGSFGLETIRDGDLVKNAIIQKTERGTTNTTYQQPGGKQNPITDHHHSLIVHLKGDHATVEAIKLEFRIYNDGLAFRYSLAQAIRNDRPVEKAHSITAEGSTFRPLLESTAWPLYLSGYKTSHEAPYTRTQFDQVSEAKLIGTPLLLELKSGPAIAITEAALRNYPGMYLKAKRDDRGLHLVSDLSPLPSNPNIKANISSPFTTPWRVVIVGAQAGKLIESNLILNLNEPSKIQDPSWLRYGKTTWNWWNGFYQEPVNFKIGANYETLKHYIDFCADHGIEFHAIDCADENWTWYQQSAPGFAPDQDTNILSPRPELQFLPALDYAKKRGVGIRLWVHWKPLSERLEEALATYAQWGVDGLMVDFLDRDDQQMIAWSEKVLQVAARHRLRIQFHGSWKPTGLRRTYPNLVNHEGVLNLEYLKWSNECTPEHNLIVPFTRMLAGPMDYHLGGFENVTEDEFIARNQHPMVLGSRCHHLAMYVVYENPVPMVCDAPSAYIDQPGFDWIQRLPTEWDETRYLAGEVGEFLVIARRKNADWFLGAMTNASRRQVPIELSFLSQPSYSATRWQDLSSTDPKALRKTEFKVRPNDTLELDLLSNGGQTLWFTPTSAP